MYTSKKKMQNLSSILQDQNKNLLNFKNFQTEKKKKKKFLKSQNKQEFKIYKQENISKKLCSQKGKIFVLAK